MPPTSPPIIERDSSLPSKLLSAEGAEREANARFLFFFLFRELPSIIAEDGKEDVEDDAARMNICRRYATSLVWFTSSLASSLVIRDGVWAGSRAPERGVGAWPKQLPRHPIRYRYETAGKVTTAGGINHDFAIRRKEVKGNELPSPEHFFPELRKNQRNTSSTKYLTGFLLESCETLPFSSISANGSFEPRVPVYRPRLMQRLICSRNARKSTRLSNQTRYLNSQYVRK